ncbi:hypothetical protein BDV11DRAFT_205703 [Aspergillus similis]
MATTWILSAIIRSALLQALKQKALDFRILITEAMAPLKIDTHQHVMPPAVKKGSIEKNPDLAQGMKAPDWTSILSCPFPLTVVCHDAAETARLAREANEYLASIRDRHPMQVGFFVTLPSAEDTARCIEEIRYALDMLKADGVVLFTSYNDKYLGHPDFEPVWRELNSRAAVVSHESTRTAVHLIMTNTMRRCAANCRVILSHGGGTLPFVAGRIADLGFQIHLSGKSADEFLADARLFYFDLALVACNAASADEGVAQQWRAVGDETLIVATRKAAQTLFPRLAD